MARTRQTLTRQELAIMKVVWQRGAVTVRDVYEALLAKRQIAYTTVMTMMNILEAKGYLRKDTQDRAFKYRATSQERTVVTSMVRDFVNRVFDGASHPLLLHLVKEGNLSDEERRELLRLIKETDK
jgi:BlaI family transcriptional regulator, penicillinase repressor